MMITSKHVPKPGLCKSFIKIHFNRQIDFITASLCRVGSKAPAACSRINLNQQDPRNAEKNLRTGQ